MKLIPAPAGLKNNSTTPMKNGLLTLICLLGLRTGLHAQLPIAKSDSVYVSLLTCAPGAALYSKFGHSAIRVYVPATGLDMVYNYGLFDFNTPNFYAKQKPGTSY